MRLLYDDVERTSGDVFLPPFDHEQMISNFLWPIDDCITAISNVSNSNFLAWNSRAHNTNQQHVVTCKNKVLCNKKYQIL